jgi:Gpi18-like mannosyltransferase
MNPPAASVVPPAGLRPTIPLPWRRIAWYFVASRIFIFIIGIISVYAIVQGGPEQTRNPLNLFIKWDANWYIRIAQQGYVRTDPGVQSSAFFPLYPLLLHAGAYVFHDLRVTGYILSNTLLLGSCLLLWKLVLRDYGRENVADRAVIFFLFCPVSFFFSTVYTESLFFFLMLAVVYLATEGRWLAAGWCGYLASLSRPVGILLALVMVAEFAAQYAKGWHSEKSTRDALSKSRPFFLWAVLLTEAGLGTYIFYLWRKFHAPVAFLQAQSYYWQRHLTFPWRPFEHFEYPAFYDVWFWGAAVTGLVLIILGFVMKLRLSHSILCVCYFVLYLSTNHLESLPRFLSVLFPFYITIGLIAVRWPRLEPLLLAGSTMLLTLSTVLFVNDYWFT